MASFLLYILTALVHNAGQHRTKRRLPVCATTVDQLVAEDGSKLAEVHLLPSRRLWIGCIRIMALGALCSIGIVILAGGISGLSPGGWLGVAGGGYGAIWAALCAISYRLLHTKILITTTSGVVVTMLGESSGVTSVEVGADDCSLVLFENCAPYGLMKSDFEGPADVLAIRVGDIEYGVDVAERGEGSRLLTKWSQMTGLRRELSEARPRWMPREYPSRSER